MNRQFFFDRARATLFGGSLSQKQVDGLTGILDEWFNSHRMKDDRWLAYMLATVHHETDRTFRPIKEYGGPRYYRRMYDITGERPQLARKYGNDEIGDGERYCGRGFVQLTWKSNYRSMSGPAGCDLVMEPDRAMEVPIATKILFHGMMNGSFTGKKLSDYFNQRQEDWKNARKIINWLDKANLIADYGKAYYACISYTTA